MLRLLTAALAVYLFTIHLSAAVHMSDRTLARYCLAALLGFAAGAFVQLVTRSL